MDFGDTAHQMNVVNNNNISRCANDSLNNESIYELFVGKTQTHRNSN